MELGVGHFIVKVLGYYANFFEKKKKNQFSSPIIYLNSWIHFSDN